MVKEGSVAEEVQDEDSEGENMYDGVLAKRGARAGKTHGDDANKMKSQLIKNTLLCAQNYDPWACD